jgi:hypothetical protein
MSETATAPRTYTEVETRRNRRIWVEALRSGEYEQGNGKLQTLSGKFCCLGVACDVFKEDNPDVKAEWVESYDCVEFIVHTNEPKPACYCGSCPPQIGFRKEVESGLPGDSVNNWLGFDGEDCSAFAAMNDESELTFEEIAIYVEEVYGT